jgi:hypothetical protein
MVLCLTEFNVKCLLIARMYNAFCLDTMYTKRVSDTLILKIKAGKEKIAKICRKRKEDRNVSNRVELVFIRYWILVLKDIVLNQATSSVQSPEVLQKQCHSIKLFPRLYRTYFNNKMEIFLVIIRIA